MIDSEVRVIEAFKVWKACVGPPAVAVDYALGQNIFFYERHKSGLVPFLGYLSCEGNNKAALAGSLNTSKEPNLT